MSASTPQNFLDTIKKRRTNYAIKDTSLPLEESEIVSLVRQVLVDTPSPWNVSSSRVIVVMNKKHKRLFNDVIRATLRETMPEEQQASIDKRAQGFAAGAGSVLFFEDRDALEDLAKEHPTSKVAIPEWSDASNGMAQFNVWTVLSVAGLGCSLQHLTFLPGIDDAIRKHLQVPANWTPKAQLVFGTPTQEAGNKLPPSADIDERIKVFA